MGDDVACGCRVLGLVHVEAVVRGLTGREERVRLLVDSGVTYTLLPEEVWKSIRLKSMREHDFILADGTVIKRKV